MRIVHFEKAGARGIAADDGSGWHGLSERESGFPGALPQLIAQDADLLRMAEIFCPCTQSTWSQFGYCLRCPAAKDPMCRSQLR